MTTHPRDKYLLVPVKVDALVIDDEIKNGSLEGAVADAKGLSRFNWRRQLAEHGAAVKQFGPVGPDLFMGASVVGGKPAKQLPDALRPEASHRGVYLRWLTPPKLRHGTTLSGELVFPPLPDQWLVVRFSRDMNTASTSGPAEVAAWFIDATATGNDCGPCELVFPDRNEGRHVAREIGKAIPLGDLKRDDLRTEPGDPITALGNRWTGSPVFTAALSENHNMLSWHDDLRDLRGREGGKPDAIPAGIALSYLVVGWYRCAGHDPLRHFPRILGADGDGIDKVLKHLSLSRMDGAGKPADSLLADGACLFHGMVAHINYWNDATYHGGTLGHPGAPQRHSGRSTAPKPPHVGIGFSLSEAFSALLHPAADPSSFASGAPAWAELEALMQNHEDLTTVTEAGLAKNAHPLGFTSLDAGRIWGLQRDEEAVNPSSPPPPAAAAERLAELNRLQGEADTLRRELAVRHQELYDDWWALAKDSKDERPRPDATADVRRNAEAFFKDAAGLEDRRKAMAASEDALRRSLPAEWKLIQRDAPRFWQPADPVVVISGMKASTRHDFAGGARYRGADDLATQATFDGAPMANRDAGFTERQRQGLAFLPHADMVTALVDEGALVERAVSSEAGRAPPTSRDDQSRWRRWVADMRAAFDRIPVHPEATRFKTRSDHDVPGAMVVEIWGEQPWSPLYLDWEISWHPTPPGRDGTDDPWPDWEFDVDAKRPEAMFDYRPKGSPRADKGTRFAGRGLLLPMTGSYFEEPVNRWSAMRGGRENLDMRNLLSASLAGQALTGLGQALLGRNVLLPRQTPDPDHPWVDRETDTLVGRARAAMSTDENRRVVPPVGGQLTDPQATVASKPARAGWFSLDHLWVIDDFGQWMDLMNGLGAAAIPHPRLRHPVPGHAVNSRLPAIAAPPRLLHPARLTVDFATASSPRRSPIRGWIYHNRVDRTLAVCGPDGSLRGELELASENVVWRSLSQAPLDGALRSFVEPLRGDGGAARLTALISLIENAGAAINPANGDPSLHLVGRPFALVGVEAGLELFGSARSRAAKALGDRRFPLRLGDGEDPHDGLLGYFHDDRYDRLVASPRLPRLAFGDYVKAGGEGVKLSPDRPSSLLLLMDPFGTVEASVGFLPPKTLSLPTAMVREAVATLEVSFRVATVLGSADRLSFPLPATDRGRWMFAAGSSDFRSASPFDPAPRFDKAPPVAVAGRVILRYGD